jgi:dTMP kinase
MASPLAGRFIAFEGADGAGKSTHLGLLAAQLRERGLVDTPGRPDLVITREPGGTALGERIREALLDGGEVTPVAEALLYAADRAQHVAEVIRPALASGALVITDRFLDSSIAYQVEGRSLPEDLVRAVNAPATGGLEPDLTILLEIGTRAAAARLDASGLPADRLESAGTGFHERVNRRYTQIALSTPGRYAVVPAEAPAAQVQQRVWEAVEGFMDRWRGAGEEGRRQ